MKYLTLLMFISTSVFGVVPIKRDEKSPVDGYVFSKKEEKQVRQKIEDGERKVVSLEELGKVHREIMGNQKTQIKMYQTYSKDLNKRLSKKTGFWEKTGWFVLGAVITGVVSYGTVRAIGHR